MSCRPLAGGANFSFGEFLPFQFFTTTERHSSNPSAGRTPLAPAHAIMPSLVLPFNETDESSRDDALSADAEAKAQKEQEQKGNGNHEDGGGAQAAPVKE